MTPQHGPDSPVGMVGVGNMGGRITRRMVDATCDVRAIDADPAQEQEQKQEQQEQEG